MTNLPEKTADYATLSRLIRVPFRPNDPSLEFRFTTRRIMGPGNGSADSPRCGNSDKIFNETRNSRIHRDFTIALFDA